jgi:hypothetical protein
MSSQDGDIEVRPTTFDQITLDFSPEMSFRNLLPAKDADWLMERIV